MLPNCCQEGLVLHLPSSLILMCCLQEPVEKNQKLLKIYRYKEGKLQNGFS